MSGKAGEGSTGFADGGGALSSPLINPKGLTFQGGYRDATGKAGQALSKLAIFHQEICQICKNTPVKKINLAGRGTFYCPKCQK